MSGAAGGTSLPHRSVSSIKSPTSGSASSNPHTPLRTITSTFGSPSSLRAEEEILILEIGTRKIQVGFAGDSVPRGQVWSGPDQLRRAGDFTAWQPGYEIQWRKRSSGAPWGQDHELWQLDLRGGLDLGLVGDKMERILREAFTKHLLIDSRPRRIVCVLDPGLPVPLLSTTLNTLFTRFQPPNISLLSSPAMTTVAAGVRSGLVIDLGWSETVVTSVYEYREVNSHRTVRGGKMLVEQTHLFLAKLIAQTRGQTYDDSKEKAQEYMLSFEECEEITSRMVWCKPAKKHSNPSEQPPGLPTVHEQDESEDPEPGRPEVPENTTISLRSSSPPNMSLDVPFDQWTEPCVSTFFASQYADCSFDDHELPLVPLVYKSLLQLPVDVRALCMSRIIFTGGCANVLGLRGRVFDDLSELVLERGWDPVRGKGAEQVKAHPKVKRRGVTRTATDGPVEVEEPKAAEAGEEDGVMHDAAYRSPEVDPFEQQLKKGTDRRPRVQGRMRAVESLGAWSGASLLTQLKVPAVATIDRELWLAQGAAGASRPGEVDFKAQQRQSMGPGGFMRGASANTSWTLGVWGAL